MFPADTPSIYRNPAIPDVTMRRLPLAVVGLILTILPACQRPPVATNVLFEKAYGLQITGNKSDAIALYKRAARAGHAGAMLALGILDDGGTVRTNLVLALTDSSRGQSRWFQDAAPALEILAASGNEEARIMLAIMLERGIGIQASPSRAVGILQAAPRTALSDYWLGWLFERRGEYESAAAFYRRASRDGVPAGYTALGLMHMNGRGVQASFGTGMALLRVGYDRGHLSAGDLYSSYLTSTEQQAAMGNIESLRHLDEFRRAGLDELTGVPF